MQRPPPFGTTAGSTCYMVRYAIQDVIVLMKGDKQWLAWLPLSMRYVLLKRERAYEWKGVARR